MPSRKHHSSKQADHSADSSPTRSRATKIFIGIVAGLTVLLAAFYLFQPRQSNTLSPAARTTKPLSVNNSDNLWIQRALDIDKLFHVVYTPCWEGANGAIGDAYLFAATRDTSLLLFISSIMTCAECASVRGLMTAHGSRWLNSIGGDSQAGPNIALVMDAKQRYDEARAEGRLSNHEGYWTWYNWPPKAAVNERIFTNSNMNQMLSIACGLYEALGEKKYLDDALLVWNGDDKTPGIEKTLYKGNGVWEGKSGRAAFGKEIPWNGTEYCSMGAALYRVTHDLKLKQLIVATAKRILNPANGWVDADDFFQIHMDGNGNFVQYLMDAYEVAPDELAEVPTKVGKMLEHVWTNQHGRATVMLHREADHAIRNGWNPLGGEDGYGVNEIGTVHAQSQAVRAFGVFAYFMSRKER